MAIVRAAGGVLWRLDSVRPRLALVHRPRHDDWSLPKGKLADREGWEEAALREVEEETGCRGRITTFAGATFYVPRRTPKIVLYWHMDLEREGPLDAGDEIDEVVWLEPGEALSKLDYGPERRLVERALLRSPPGTQPKGLVAAEIATARAELLRAILALEGEGDPSGIGPALSLLDQAEDAAGRSDLEAARGLTLAARRMALLGLRGSELTLAARAVREEARSLAPARRRAIRRLLPSEERPAPEAVYLAATIRDEATGTVPRTHRLMSALVGAAGAGVALVATLADPARGWPTLLSAIGAGLIGGAAASALVARARGR